MSDTVFTLEALRARHGDCLILHYGRASKPRRILIDGGAAGVYKKYLKPRLEALRGDDDLLRFEMLMVSHIDDDHIRGVLDLMQELRDTAEEHRAMPYRFKTLWHNSFDDILGNEAEALRVASVASVGGDGALAASLEGDAPVDGDLSLEGRAVIASVPQGRTLRLHAEALGVPFNRRPGQSPGAGLDALISVDADTPPVDMRSGLTFRIVGPLRRRVVELQERWDKDLKKKGLAQESEGEAPNLEPAAYVDGSVFNLASLVLWAELDGKTMLLTGDARGDDILEGAELAGLLDQDGNMKVDLLKLPHHGSDRNVAPDFFRRIRADHYVLSGDGRHGNPEIATFRMLLEARQEDGEPYTIYLTYNLDELNDRYPVDELRAFLEQAEQDGHAFTLVTPETDDGSVAVALL